MGFTWIDWVIAGIIAISVLISLKRGFVKETLSLLTWIAAIFVAWAFGSVLAKQWTGYIQTPSVRIILASLLLLIATLIAGAVLNKIITNLVQSTKLSGANRLLGMVFGGLRGCILVMTLTGLMIFTPLIQDNAWQKSVLLPRFLILADWSKRIVADIMTPLLNKNEMAL